MPTVLKTVEKIILDVRKKGDVALCAYAKKFDRVALKPSQLRVSSETLLNAYNQVTPEFRSALEECAKHIRTFARLEKLNLPKTWLQEENGKKLGQLIRPVDSVGVYIPGGRFPYPSTVLMTVIPAKEAGVARIVMCSPPKNFTPEVMAAAYFAGVDELYQVGGPSSIAALAYGTKQIKPVRFIVGPGNAYVTEAKRQVYGQVGIDSLAGPSEVAVIADEKTPLDYILYDLQAQAEHDPNSISTLYTTSASVIAKIQKKLDKATKSRVRLIRVDTIEQAIDQANDLAPEHFELLIENAEAYLPLIKHAGAVFLGPASPAAIGDYVAGPSHVLPTQRSAQFSSGLSVMTFLKRSSVISFQGTENESMQWNAAITMAQTEGMPYHEKSLHVRRHW